MSKIVTFEQAKRLGKHGFNESVNSGYIGYTKDGELVSRYQYSQDKEYQTIPCWIKAPTVCHALDWVREEKEILCAVELVKETNRFGGTIGYKYGGAFIDDKGKETLLPTHDTHPLASSALLDAVLTYLEQKEKK